MANLVIDRGNHSTKAYIFSEGKIVRQETFSNESTDGLVQFVQANTVDAAILSSVLEGDSALAEELQLSGIVVTFSAKTPTPLKLGYTTPETLGSDRLAAALAGWQLSGGGSVLVIVAGTCITYNIVEPDGTFAGGAISPGLNMRLEAMHQFTGKLPLIGLKGEHPLTGKSTEQSLRSGAVNGAIEEVKGMISSYTVSYPSLKTVISGGDGAFLAEALKNGIFARPELVAEGLNTILNYNVANRLTR